MFEIKVVELKKPYILDYVPIFVHYDNFEKNDSLTV